jgi:hypothetical protein
MDSKILLSVLALAAATSLSAKQITADEAMLRLNSSNGISAAKVRTSQQMVNTQTIYTPTNSAALYLVKQADDRLLILPADDRVEPLLGYTDAPAEGQMPEQLQWWLNEYASQIQYLQSQPDTGNNISSPRHATARTAISPMVTTHWNQDAPYNNQCPTINGVATYTGCVATAAAQLMNYNKYPTVGTGSISYTDSYKNSYSMDFTEQEFDWANMLNSYKGEYTDAQANAVAYLMKAVGHAAQMNYGTSESGASSTTLAGALKTYFNYNSNLEILFREYYTLDEWETLIYNNLKTVGPVYYAGDDTESGHAFVCDGYSDGYFHFNWGWGGSYDGYFQTTALLPQGQGIGGNAGGYNFGQQIICNIAPPEHATIDLPSNNPLSISGNLTGAVVGTTSAPSLYLSCDATDKLALSNKSSESHVFYMYLVLTNTTPDSSTGAYNVYRCGPLQLSLDPGWGYYGLTLTMPSIPTGTYKVELASYVDNLGGELLPVSRELSCVDYFYATFDDNKNLAVVSNVSGNTPVIGSVSLSNQLYWGQKFKLSFTASNNGDEECYYGVYPALYTYSTDVTTSTASAAPARRDEATKTISFLATGDDIALTLQPNTSKDVTMVSEMSIDATTYPENAYLGLFSTSTDELITSTPVDIKTTSDTGKISATKFVLEGDNSKADASNLKFDCNVTCASDIYYEPIHIYLIKDGEMYVSVYINSSDYFLTKGETVDTVITGSIPDATEGDKYTAYLGYVVDHVIQDQQNLTFTVGETVSAIEELNADEADKEVLVLADRRMGCILVNAPATIAKIEVYGLDGRMVYSEANVNDNSASFAMNHKGLNIVKVTLTDGTNIVRKVAL